MMRDVKVSHLVDMRKFSSLRIGGTLQDFYEVFSLEGLQNVLRFLQKKRRKYIVIGNGSKLLFPDTFRVRSGIKVRQNQIQFYEEYVKVGAGAKLATFARLLTLKGYEGGSGLCDIPGDIGGSIVNNAGAFQDEIGAIVESVDVVDSKGNIHTYQKNELDFSYRYSRFQKENLGIIFQVRFRLIRGDLTKLQEKMKENHRKRITAQPIGIRTLGSTFKNPSIGKAAFFIFQTFPHGYHRKGIRLHPKQMNFIEIEGKIKAKEIWDFIAYVRKKVYNKMHVLLESEIQKKGW